MSRSQNRRSVTRAHKIHFVAIFHVKQYSVTWRRHRSVPACSLSRLASRGQELGHRRRRHREHHHHLPLNSDRSRLVFAIATADDSASCSHGTSWNTKRKRLLTVYHDERALRKDLTFCSEEGRGWRRRAQQRWEDTPTMLWEICENVTNLSETVFPWLQNKTNNTHEHLLKILNRVDF